MIWRIWFQCLLILIMMAVPLMAIQYFQQKESLHLMHDLNNQEETVSTLQKQMGRLQEFAKIKPQQEEDYKKDFFNLLKIKKSVAEMEQVQKSVIRSLEKQSLYNMGIIAAIALILSLGVSWNIVRHFKKLLLERELFLKKQNELERLEQWQNTARCLVHELRAPLTPIKLINSTWEGALADALIVPTDLSAPPLDLSASQSLQKENQSLENPAPPIPTELLREGVGVIASKLHLIETMINRFTVFAKLPSPEMRAAKLSEITLHFIEQYKDNFNAELSFNNKIDQEPMLMADEGLLHNAFYAIVKNAIEANPIQKLKIDFKIKKLSRESQLTLSICNNGDSIPAAIVPNLFEFGVSSKLPGSHNFGIGLAMAKKISYQHNAELILANNIANTEVSFQFLFIMENQL